MHCRQLLGTPCCWQRLQSCSSACKSVDPSAACFTQSMGNVQLPLERLACMCCSTPRSSASVKGFPVPRCRCCSTHSHVPPSLPISPPSTFWKCAAHSANVSSTVGVTGLSIRKNSRGLVTRSLSSPHKNSLFLRFSSLLYWLNFVLNAALCRPLSHPVCFNSRCRCRHSLSNHGVLALSALLGLALAVVALGRSKGAAVGSSLWASSSSVSSNTCNAYCVSTIVAAAIVSNFSFRVL